MNANIDITLMKNDFSTNKKQNNDYKPKTKVKIYDFFTLNEVKVCKKIEKIQYYYNFFEIIKKYQLLEVGQMNKNMLEKLDIIVNTQKNDKYLLVEYNTNKNAKYMDFINFLFHIPSPKLLIFHTLDSYSYLLESLIKLNIKKICFFDLCPENIFFAENYKPLLKNFKTSILIETIKNQTINENYIEKIITKITSFTHKPLEIHLLFYLIINNEISLSYSILDIISTNYIENLTVLSFFSHEYRENFKKECIDFLKIYINKPKHIIINEILGFCNTWDNYSLSILYLHIFGNITNVFSLTETFINKLIIILSKNILPNPLKRETLENTMKMYNILFTEFTDWTYVNNIPRYKIDYLYEIL